jgi:alpha-methylacyl-CoA racemase
MLKRTGPLRGLRVVEMAGIGPVPFSCMHLADLGAEVVQIARPNWSMPLPLEQRFNLTDRCRRKLPLDLKEPEDRDVLWELIDRAEVLIEGYRPGVMERLGFGPKEVLSRRPSIVFGRMTGWGQSGPLAQAAGHDINYAALSGAIWSIGGPDTPPPSPLNVVADLAGGAMMLTTGVLAALFHARGSGEGQVVDVAMTDGSAYMLTAQYGMLAAGCWSDERGANFMNDGCAWYGCYETSDGGYVAIASVEPQFYTERLTSSGLADDPLFGDQHDRTAVPAMRRKLAALFRTRTRAEWCELLEGSDACFAPVLSMTEAPTHPHNRQRGTFIETDGIVQPGPAPRFSSTPCEPPTHGDAGKVSREEIRAAWEQTSCL